MSPSRRTVVQGGRAKAYRPLPAARRRAALGEALAAYERGDVFLAHELLEPAWMGTAEPRERDLYQGLIKLAAAGVHEVRGNPAGEAKNLRGALARLESAMPGTAGEPTSGQAVPRGAAGRRADAGLDLPALCNSIRARLVELGRITGGQPAEGRSPRGGPRSPATPNADRGGGPSAPVIPLPRHAG
ncbi:MAG TPA: DUF309 domain-containing protein [Candidatus Dormibacteraeota bacterium]|nr:DUF309 domain-containing protein [Candidatus Dormibacteraeota bacterium]